MEARKIDGLDDIYYIYDKDKRIAIVNDGDIFWADGVRAEPWQGATAEVKAAIAIAEAE